MNKDTEWVAELSKEEAAAVARKFVRNVYRMADAVDHMALTAMFVQDKDGRKTASELRKIKRFVSALIKRIREAGASDSGG